MENPKFDFKQFSKKEWLELIANSLKTGSLKDFVWQLNDEVEGEPFAHFDELGKDVSPIKSSNTKTGWLSGLDYSLIDFDKVNSYIKTHSKYGLQSMIIELLDSSADIKHLFKGIDLNLYDINFNASYGTDLIIFLDNFKDCLQSRGYSSEKLNITLRLPINRPHLMLELYKYTKINFPLIKFYFKTDREYSYDPVKYLSETLNTLTDFVKKSDMDTELMSWLFKKLKFHFFLTEKFLSNIATLRAFKILWNNYLNSFNTEISDANIMLGINHDAFTDDINNDLIIATILSMSGTIANVNSINLAPKTGIEDEENIMRLMLNIQNIIKYESNMSLVTDALNGSYAIEDATEKLAEEVWEKID